MSNYVILPVFSAIDNVSFSVKLKAEKGDCNAQVTLYGKSDNQDTKGSRGWPTG